MPKPLGSSSQPHLLREQANAVQLYLQYKGYHWNVAGPRFRELHLLFDEHAAKVLETIDALAERQRMLGAPARYTVTDLARAANLESDAALPTTTLRMIERLLVAHRTIIAGLRDGIRAAEADGDPATLDLLVRTLQEHEKMAWFLREQASPVPPSPEEAAAYGVPSERPAVPLGPPHAGPAPLPGRAAR